MLSNMLLVLLLCLAITVMIRREILDLVSCASVPVMLHSVVNVVTIAVIIVDSTLIVTVVVRLALIRLTLGGEEISHVSSSLLIGISAASGTFA